MGYGHRGIVYTILRTPEIQEAFAQIDRSIEIHPVHEYLGNHEAAQRDRDTAPPPSR